MKELRLEDLSIEQKIGMLFVVRCFRDEEDKAFFPLLKVFLLLPGNGRNG